MRPDDGRLNLWPVGVIGFFAVLAVASITPVVRLNSVAPPAFVALRASSGNADAKEASGYWEAAVEVIQWKYPRTAPLPETVPSEFNLGNASAGNDSPQQQAARAAYWAKLRQEWMKSENWHKTVKFDVAWIIDDIESISHGVRDFVTDHS